MARLESSIQRSVVTYAKERHRGALIARKVEAGKFGSTGWPDYEFLCINRHTFFIEFKAEGKLCTELQLQRHKELRALGYEVAVIDNVPAGRGFVDVQMRKAYAKPAAPREAAG